MKRIYIYGCPRVEDFLLTTFACLGRLIVCIRIPIRPANELFQMVTSSTVITFVSKLDINFFG